MTSDFDGFRDSKPGRSTRPSGRTDTLPGVAPPARGSKAPPDHAHPDGSTPYRSSDAYQRMVWARESPTPDPVLEARPRAATSSRSNSRSSVVLLVTAAVLLGCALALLNVLKRDGSAAVPREAVRALSVQPSIEARSVAAVEGNPVRTVLAAETQAPREKGTSPGPADRSPARSPAARSPGGRARSGAKGGQSPDGPAAVASRKMAEVSPRSF